MVDPFDPSAGASGNMVYVLSETFAAHSGFQKHVALAAAQIPDWFERLKRNIVRGPLPPSTRTPSLFQLISAIPSAWSL